MLMSVGPPFPKAAGWKIKGVGRPRGGRGRECGQVTTERMARVAKPSSAQRRADEGMGRLRASAGRPAARQLFPWVKASKARACEDISADGGGVIGVHQVVQRLHAIQLAHAMTTTTMMRLIMSSPFVSRRGRTRRCSVSPPAGCPGRVTPRSAPWAAARRPPSVVSAMGDHRSQLMDAGSCKERLMTNDLLASPAYFFISTSSPSAQARATG
jgi:hypothetical protein